jgi:hypothetical protein
MSFSKLQFDLADRLIKCGQVIEGSGLGPK